jgi:hypothetical protein
MTTIGVSGAIYGLALAYGVLFPNRIIYLYMIIPSSQVVRRYLRRYCTLPSMSYGSYRSHAHLGGMLVGFMYLRRPVFPTSGGADRWHRNRLRRKFEVYYNERRRDDDDQQKWRRWRN